MTTAAASSFRHLPLRDSILGLAALFIPGLGFASAMLSAQGQFATLDLTAPLTAPWQLWIMGVFGSAATICGFLDWHYHATGRRLVSAKERHGELIALLCGGLPLFTLMTLATISENPGHLLVPILLAALFTVVMVCYDEFVFHRRACTRYESTLHRILTLGNGTAWMAWMHWVYA